MKKYQVYCYCCRKIQRIFYDDKTFAYESKNGYIDSLYKCDHCLKNHPHPKFKCDLSSTFKKKKEKNTPTSFKSFISKVQQVVTISLCVTSVCVTKAHLLISNLGIRKNCSL